MYACKQCGTGNPLDSSFCKKCGNALPADEVAEARVKLGEMLDEGNSLFTEGRTDEAMLIAEAAVTANPSSHLAYSLKGLCHERQGQIAEALECYETAVGLNADSSLDKVKVAALRNRLAQRATEAPEPNRRSAAMIGVAAAVLFLVGGSLAAIGMSGKKTPQVLAENPPTSGQQVAPVTQMGPPQGATTNPSSTPTSGASSPNSAPPTVIAPGSGNAREASPEPHVDLPPAGNRLPAPDLGGGTIPPAPIVGRLEGGSAPEAGPTRSRNDGGDPAPTPLDDNKTTPPVTTAKTDEEAPSYIHIQMAPTAPRTQGGGAPIPDGNGLKAVLEAAQVDYQTGKYENAAGKYLRVANMGGNSPRIQQRLGDCYRNLGNSAKARVAYNRAITMYQTQIKLGTDVARNQAGLDTCESALKVLGG